MFITKLLEIVGIINSLFYGEQWYIYWGIVLAIVAVPVGVNIPSFIKSIKAAKERGKTNINIYSGKQGSGKRIKYKGGDK